MPRQLPWLSAGGGSHMQTKNTTKPAKKENLPSELDDDFFDGTALASSKKGKGKVKISRDDSDDDLLSSDGELAAARRDRKNGKWTNGARLPSSSPPPIQDDIQPSIEFMRTGSKFDLRDDEWMMVEDEFLETAKLFTRHLHIAEYEKLKKQIEDKKKEQVEAARPVTESSAMSTEGKMKEKAKVQEKKQMKAIRDVFASQDVESDDDKEHYFNNGKISLSTKPTTSIAKPKPTPQSTRTYDSDSDDLDVPIPPSKHNPKPTKAVPSNSGSKADLKPESSTSSFVKPSIPSTNGKPRVANSRRPRSSAFDLLDDYVPKNRTQAQPSVTQHTPTTSRATARVVASSSPPKTFTISSNRRSAIEDDDSSTGRRDNSAISKETADRLAKRKAERDKDGQDKKALKLDDIPTFLF